MRRLTTCLVCGGTNLKLLYPATYHGGPEEAHHYFMANRRASAHEEIRRCIGCGFVFTARQFEEEQYYQIYRRIGISTSETSAATGAGAAAAQARFTRLKSIIAAYTDFERPFLDFGCGNGDFLRAVDSPAGAGFEVNAPDTRRGPGGSTIFSGRWSAVAGSAALPWGSQNLVTAFDVFEHLCNLEGDVALIRRVLSANGYFFVTIPDEQSLTARLSRRHWNMLLLEHLWYFSGATLDRFLSRHGFAPLMQRAVPYDAAIGHITKRIGESLRLRLPQLPLWINEIVIPVPAGVLLAGYRAKD